MKRSRHTRIPVTALMFAALTTVAALGGGTAAADEESGLSQRFSANLYGDVTTVGNSLAECPSTRDCPQASAATLSIPEDATIAHARLQWASGLGADCRALPAVTDPRLRVNDEAVTVAGAVTGRNTAETELTEELGSLEPGGEVPVTVEGIRSDGCAAGWSMTVAYEVPPVESGDIAPRHVAIYSGASGPSATAVDVTGFRRSPDDQPHLNSTVYGKARLRVNDTPVATESTSHVRSADVPARAMAAEATSADVRVDGENVLVQQLALSVPVTGLSFSATATPREVGPGDTVVHTVTVTNRDDRKITGAAFRVDLSRALDDATRPFDVTASRGETLFAGRSLKWTGTVPADGEVTLTYSMTIKNPRPGDGRLDSTVIGGQRTNCPASSPSTECQVKLRFPAQPTSSAPTVGGDQRILPTTGAALSVMAAVAVAALTAGALLLGYGRRFRNS